MITFSVLLLAINLWIVSLLCRFDMAQERKLRSLEKWSVEYVRTTMAEEMRRVDRTILKCVALRKKLLNEVRGKADQVLIKSSIATKMADRAFNMASSANLGVVALQKALATPRLINRGQSKLNELAKNSVDELFVTQGEFDWLKPLLNDNDLDLLEEIEQKKLKDQMKS